MSLNAQRIADVLLVISVIVLITMPELVMNGFIWFFHSLVEFLHISFEAIESTLDFLIEALFHTGLHNTQVIVFYVMMAGVGYGAYKLWRKLPRIYATCRENIVLFLLLYKTRFIVYWRNAGLLSKIRMIVIVSVLSYLFVLLSF
jgi:hypothetical protein